MADPRISGGVTLTLDLPEASRAAADLFYLEAIRQALSEEMERDESVFLLGEDIGVFGGAWTVARFTKASLSSSLRWADVLAVGILAGIGFTVSLLIDELAFEGDPLRTSAAKIGVLLASVLAAVLAAVALRLRARAYAAIAAEEEADSDGDGVPDVYGASPGAPEAR